MILAATADHHDAMILAERVREAIEQHEYANDLHITANFGVATCSHAPNIASLVHRADRRLYQAKGRGRNLVVGEGAEVAPPA